MIRYVVLNPLRAKRVRLPERWAWSSYGGATAGVSAVPPWLAVDEVRGQFGGSGAAYRRFVAQGTALPSVWEDLRGQMWLGGEKFRGKMQHRLGGKRGADVSRAQREPARPNPDELLAEVATAFDLPRNAVLDRRHAQTYRCAKSKRVRGSKSKGVNALLYRVGHITIAACLVGCVWIRVT